jgi:hypothetical protein
MTTRYVHGELRRQRRVVCRRSHQRSPRPLWRYHTTLTGSQARMVQAERRRDRVTIEQIFADVTARSPPPRPRDGLRVSTRLIMPGYSLQDLRAPCPLRAAKFTFWVTMCPRRMPVSAVRAVQSLALWIGVASCAVSRLTGHLLQVNFADRGSRMVGTLTEPSDWAPVLKLVLQLALRRRSWL